jgi:hypothetical protein
MLYTQSLTNPTAEAANELREISLSNQIDTISPSFFSLIKDTTNSDVRTQERSCLTLQDLLTHKNDVIAIEAFSQLDKIEREAAADGHPKGQQYNNAICNLLANRSILERQAALEQRPAINNDCNRALSPPNIEGFVFKRCDFTL